MKRALPSISRALVAVLAFAVVFVFCPCVPGTEAAMDECCHHLELSISSLCCDSAPTVSPAPVSPAVVSVAAPSAVRVTPADFHVGIVSVERPVFRSVAAPAILRI